jgi:hypothetical protein
LYITGHAIDSFMKDEIIFLSQLLDEQRPLISGNVKKV